MTERDRLTTERRKIFVRESLTIMSMTKDELRQHYNEIFDRLQEYEVAEENNQIIVPPCKVGDTVYYVSRGRIERLKIRNINYSFRDREYYVYLENDSGSAMCIGYNQLIGYKLFHILEEAEKALKGE